MNDPVPSDMTVKELKDSAVPFAAAPPKMVGDRVNTMVEVYHIPQNGSQVSEVVSRAGRTCATTEQAYKRTKELQPGEEMNVSSGWLDAAWCEFICCHNIPPQQHQQTEEVAKALAAKKLTLTVGGVSFDIRPGGCFVGTPTDRSCKIVVRNTGTVPTTLTVMLAPE